MPSAPGRDRRCSFRTGTEVPCDCDLEAGVLRLILFVCTALCGSLTLRVELYRNVSSQTSGPELQAASMLLLRRTTTASSSLKVLPDCKVYKHTSSDLTLVTVCPQIIKSGPFLAPSCSEDIQEIFPRFTTALWAKLMQPCTTGKLTDLLCSGTMLCTGLFLIYNT